MKSSIIFLLLLFFIHFGERVSAAPNEKPSPQVKVYVKYDGGSFFLRIKNVSRSPLKFGPVNFSDSVDSGFWVFIYDVEKKQIEQGYALTTPIFGGGRDDRYDREVGPLEEINVVFKKSQVMQYFMEEPRCYYVIFLYRKRDVNKLVFSNASTPILQCGPHGGP